MKSPLIVTAYVKLLSSLRELEFINESSRLFIAIFEKIPESEGPNGGSHTSWSDKKITQSIFGAILRLCESHNLSLIHI